MGTNPGCEKIIQKAKVVVDEFIDKYPDAHNIGLTGQMHGIVYLNAEGRSVSPLYTSQDGRGNICDDKTGKSLLKEKSKRNVSTRLLLVMDLSHIYIMKNIIWFR